MRPIAAAIAARTPGARSGSSSCCSSTPTRAPFTGTGATGIPATTPSSSAAWATVRARIPTWSHVGASGCTPVTGTSPAVGFSPTTPQYAAGIRTEPPQSVPIASSHTPAPTSAAEPPLEPPEVRSGSRGFRVMPNAGATLPAECSSRLVLQNSSAEAARNRATTSHPPPPAARHRPAKRWW